MLVFLALVIGLVLRGKTPEERAQLRRDVLALLRTARSTVTSPPPGCEAFQHDLRARTRWALVTPVLVIVQVSLLVLIALEPGALSDTPTLVEWGASIGPRTTNGEWWRLATSMFVHLSVLHVMATVAGLLQVGILTERLVGPWAYVVVYAAAGLLAGLWNLSVYPVALHAGAAGAVFGVYGLLAASMIWELVHRSALRVPVGMMKQLWPGVMIFLVYHVVTEGVLSQSMRAGLAVGLAGGMALFAGRHSSAKPAARRVWATTATGLAVVVLTAVPLRGLADVTVEVARVMAIEDRTAKAYALEVERFRKGRLGADVLVQFATRTAAELESAHAELMAIDKVPGEHQAMMVNASQYLRIRQESWRLRSEGLSTGHMRTLQQADAAEHAALTALRKATSARTR